MTFDRVVQPQIFDPLFDLDEHTNPVPVVAQSWEQPDATTAVLRVRPGVTFHDGTPCDAEAVKWNLERQLDPATKSINRSLLESIRSVDVLDPLALKLVLAAPDPALLANLAGPTAGRLVSKAAQQRLGDDLRRNPVGAGPFRFVEWVPDSHITVRRNERYWRPGLPHLDQITFRTVPQSGVKLTELRTGNADLIDDVQVRDASHAQTEPDLEVSMLPGLGYLRIDLNAGREPFDRKPLRQALAAAIDRTALDRIVYLGAGAVARGPFPPSSWAFDPALAVAPTTADPELARRRLAEGGRPDGFTFALDTLPVSPRLQIAQVVQEQLRQVGIEMEILSLEEGPFQSRRTSREFQARLAPWGGSADPIGNVYAQFVTGGASNFSAYSNPALDQQLEIARTRLDRDERSRAFRDVQRLIAEDAPSIFLYHEPTIRVWSRRLRGFRAQPDRVVRLAEVWLE